MARPRATTRPAPAPAPVPAPPPMTRSAFAVALVVAALAALAAVTTAFHDPDLWQHLVVGREIWRTHAIPMTQLWSWPTWGQSEVLPSWLFRALLWPFWAAGGVAGLEAWRWLTTLAAFGMLLAAARRAGATGVAPLVALVACVLLYRQRSQARPETLVAVIVAAELLLLETRRRWLATPGREALARRLAWGVVPIALVWANTHISYYLGFVIAGAYLLDDLLRPGDRGARGLPVSLLALAAAAGASFINPFGVRALAQPVQYFLEWRHEPIYQSIGELGRIEWSENLRNGLPLTLVVLAVSAVVRARRRGPDWAQLAILGVALPQAFASQRFLGYLAVLAAPFFARDLGELASAVAWPRPLHAPVRRAALVALACVAIVVPELSRPQVGFGWGVLWSRYPVAACDWIESHGVRGRSFSTFGQAGWLLWRFFPQRDRLPFMDIHQSGTKELRYVYAWALQDSAAWRQLDGRWRFDWALVPRELPATPSLLDVLDADSSWALVFADDAAALYLRRAASGGGLADSAYRVMPAGRARLSAIGARAWSDSAYRAALRADLDRARGSSPWNGRAHALAANVALMEGRWSDARFDLERALALRADEPRLHERLGLALLHGGDPAGALAAFEREHHADAAWTGWDRARGDALAALGRRAEAVATYERALARDPGDAAARDSLAALRAR